MARKKQDNSIQSKIKALNNNFVDLTKTGPLTGRQMQQLDPNFRELPENAVIPDTPDIFSRAGKINYTNQPTDFGSSHWDPGIANANEFEHYQDVRATQQPWYSKAVNGLAKGAVLAGTTFLDGTIGLLTGLADMGYTAINGGNSSEVWSKLWDNPFSNAMQNITDWTEENLPNYYTTYEQEHPFTFDTNFIFDKFIKNLGFTIGAVWSGGIYSAPFKIAKIAKGLQIAGKAAGLSTRTALKVPSMVSMATGTLLSAISEGRIEAINNARDHARQQQNGLDEGYAQLINNRYDPLKQAALQQFETDREIYGEQAALYKYQQTVSDLDSRAEQEYANRINDPNYQRVQTQIEKDRLSFGNADLLMNLPILTLSHVITFGKIFGGGYKTSRRINNALERAARPKWQRNIAHTAKILKGSASEGTEEIMQRAASDASGFMYGISDFHKALTDPKGEKQGLDLINAITEGMKKTFTDPSAWEEFTIGALTGLFGVPMVRSRTKEDGTKQSPIYIIGGFYDEFREAVEKDKKAEELADYVNNRLKDPKTINYYRGLNRHNKYQNDMDKATENGSIYDYKNAQHAQFISDIIMFDNAGELNTLKGIINEILDTSDDNLDALVTTTSAIQPDGTIAGPYAKYAAVENGKIVSALNENNREEFKQTIEKRRRGLLDQIKDYNNTKDEIDIETGENFTNDQLKELTYLGTVVNDRTKRASKTFENEKEGIRALAEKALSYAKKQAEKQSKSKDTIINKKDKKDTNNQESKPLDYTDKRIIQALETIANANSLEQIQKASKDKFGMIRNLSTLGRVVNEAGLSEDPIMNTLDDLSNLTVDSMMYEAKLAEFKSNPNKLQEETDAADAERADEVIQEKTKNFRTKIQNAKNRNNIKQAFAEDDGDDELNYGIIQDEAKKGNIAAQNFLQVDSYASDVEDAINDLDIDDAAKERAINLFSEHLNKSDNLDQASNINSQWLQPNDPTNSQDVEDSAHVVQAINTVNKKRKNGQSFSPSATPNTKQSKSPQSNPKGVQPKQKQGYSDPNEPVIGGASAKHSASMNQQVNEQTSTINKNKDGQFEFWKSTVTEVPIDCDKTGNFTPTPQNNGFEYLKTIYEYLKGQGNDAFNFLDEGGVKTNDEIEFIIDPNLEQKYKDDKSIVDYKGPTVLFRHKKSGRIIGNVPLDTNKYVGLTSTIERINKEYNEFIKDQSNKNKIFISKETTKVRQILPGKLKFTEEWIALSSVSGFSSNDAVFALVDKNGTITSTIDRELIRINNIDNPGTLYLLLKNPAGTYTPITVNVAHFNNEELLKLKTTYNLQVKALLEELFTQNSLNKINSNVFRGPKGFVSKLNNIINCNDLMFNVVRHEGIPCIEIGHRLRNEDGTLRADGHEHKYYIPLATDNKVATFSGWDAETSTISDDELWGKNEKGQNYITARSKEDIITDVMNALLDANVPIQIKKEDVTNSSKMKEFIDNSVLTTNLESTHFYNTWFTTDYIDNNGQQQTATKLKRPVNKPKVPKTPDSKGSNVDLSTLTCITYKGFKYYIDRSNNAVYNKDGKRLNLSKRHSDRNIRNLLFNAAYAFEVYGDARNGVNMIDHKLLIHTNKDKVIGIDLDNIRWLTKEELTELQSKLAGKKPKSKSKPKVDSEAKKRAISIVNQIIERQQKVDRSATTSKAYSILEDDGQYYSYDRVHNWLGDNYEGKRSENKSTKSIDAGNSVDVITRTFFNAKNDSEIKAIKKPDNMSDAAFKTLIDYLTTVKNTIEKNGETFYANNLVIFHKYADGTRIAGEIDILSITADGKFKIYDMKTSKSSFYDGNKLSSVFTTPQQYGTKGKQKISTQSYYTQQLSAYKNLFESEYDATVDSLALMPFHIEFDNNGEGNVIETITPQKGISLKYDPNTPVKLDRAKPNTPSTPQQTSNKSLVEDDEAFNNYAGKKLDGTTEGLKTQDGEMQIVYFTDGTTVFKGNGAPIKVNNNTIGYFVVVKNESGVHDYYYVFNNGSSIKTGSSTNTDAKEFLDGMNQVYVVSKQRLIDLAANNSKFNSFANKGKTLQDIYKIEPQQTHIPKITDDFPKDYTGEVHRLTGSLLSFDIEADALGKNYTLIMYNNNGVLYDNFGYLIKDKEGNTLGYLVHLLAKKEGDLVEYGIVLQNGSYVKYTTKQNKQFEWSPTTTGKIFNTIQDQLTLEQVNKLQEKLPSLKDLFNQNSANPSTNNQTAPAATPRIAKGEIKQGKSKPRLRETTKQEQEVWNQKKELNWAKKNLPKGISVSIVKGLIRVAEKGATAWGSFCDNIITLSDIAARGTTYHEAFHAIFDNYLTAEEQEDILKDARERWSGQSYDEIMENLAESFKEYVQTKEDKSLWGKIKDFFIDLFYKVTNWKTIRPSMNSYFRMINAGRFSNRSVQRNSDIVRNRLIQNNEETMTKVVKRFLNNFDIKINEIDEFDSNEPLFDALNRVINIKNVDDITDGTGYAVAFMMQHSPLIKELISLHQSGDQSFKIKGIRRVIRKRGEFTIDDITRDLDKDEALKEIGKDIAVELRKFYNLQTVRKSNSYISKIWEVIREFFNIMTHRQRTILKTIQNNTIQIANAIVLNDTSIIRSTLNKPGTTTKAERVNIGKVLKENPYENEIIIKLQKHNIALAGSASIALSGTLFRPSENPLHDIDFNASGKSKEEMDAIIKEEFPYSTYIRTIDNDGNATQTYLILDREFTLSHTKDSSQYFIKDKDGNIIGSFIKSELVLAKGVKGKFLDFFTGKSLFGNHAMSINGRTYLISDYRNAFDAKVNWAREKDIWDYNNFVSNTTDRTLQEQRVVKKTELREKLKKTRVIWAHPAIGKTTYLEKNDDILEWDDIVNPKRDKFIKQQLDPNNTMDENSQEYKDLKQQYMTDWINHPEYVEFLTNEWNKLISRAKKENKRVFASPLPLLDIGANDIDLIVALNNRDFIERNQQRGGSMYGSRSWNQAIDAALSRQDPNKVKYTDKYFSEFMRENLGVHWGTLTSEEEELLKAKGFTEEEFESMSQLERDKAVECAGF